MTYRILVVSHITEYYVEKYPGLILKLGFRGSTTIILLPRYAVTTSL